MIDQIDESPSIKALVRAWTIKLLGCVVVAGTSGRGALELYHEGTTFAHQKQIEFAQYLLPPEMLTGRAAEPLRRTSSLPLSQLMELAAKDHGINVAVFRAVAEQESGRDSNQLTRYEPRLREKYGCMKGEEERDCKMRFSSLGVMHIIPHFHAGRCNLSSWRDLLNDEINVHCSGKILRDCYKSTGSLQGMLSCYNGSGPDAQRYAQTVASKINGFMIEKRG